MPFSILITRLRDNDQNVIFRSCRNLKFDPYCCDSWRCATSTSASRGVATVLHLKLPVRKDIFLPERVLLIILRIILTRLYVKGGGGVNLNDRFRAVAKGLLRTIFFNKLF